MRLRKPLAWLYNAEGQEVGLEYLGLAKSEKTGWEYHNFKVFKRPMEEIS